MGNNLDYDNWLWVSSFEAWDSIDWKEVETNGAYKIKEILKTFIENLDGLNL